MVYVAIGFVAAALLTLAQWWGGGYPVGTLRSTQVLLGAAAGVYPWLVRRFNVSAGRAMRTLEPLLVVGEGERAELAYRLMNLPRTPALLLGLGTAAAALVRFGVVSPAARALFLTPEPGPTAMSLLVLVAVAFIGSAVIFKAVYQAWLIHRITTREIRVGLFDIATLYGFATLTGMMAASLVVSGLVFSLSEPYLWASFDPIALGSLLFGLTLATAVFVLPLVGVHERLVAEKERMKAVTRHQMGIAQAELHRVVEANDLAAMDPLNKAIVSLDIELRGIVEAPTWPWRSDTFRWVVGVLMIPLVLFLLQQVVPRLMP